MELTLIYTIIGFGLAGYSVIANDSIQTLGTFIASKKKWFAWYILAGSASFVMILALAWGWYSYDGDISYGRLTRIPYQEIQWYHAVAPAILLILTRVGIPVSTTFLVLSAFASTVVPVKSRLPWAYSELVINVRMNNTERFLTFFMFNFLFPYA